MARTLNRKKTWHQVSLPDSKGRLAAPIYGKGSPFLGPPYTPWQKVDSVAARKGTSSKKAKVVPFDHLVDQCSWQKLSQRNVSSSPDEAPGQAAPPPAVRMTGELQAFPMTTLVRKLAQLPDARTFPDAPKAGLALQRRGRRCREDRTHQHIPQLLGAPA